MLGLSAPVLRSQTATATFGEVIRLGATPSYVLLDESRGRLYAVISEANRVEIYDYQSKTVAGSVRVGLFPSQAAISPDNTVLYVANVQSASLSVVDLNTGGLVQTVSLPARPEGVEVGLDGRVLITTQGAGPGNTLNTLLLFDRTQQNFQQVSAVPFPPPINTPNPLPQVFAGRPSTAFPGRLSRTPDGQFIVGMVAINQNLNNAQTTLFVYEVASGTVLRSRTVTGQSTVLAMAPDGSRFMAGSTLYDTATLAVMGQMNPANFPFFTGNGFSPNINLARNLGGSAVTPDGETLYGAFNTAATNARPEARALLISNPRNLGVRLGIRLPESILGRMVVTQDGAHVWAASESGLLYLPMSTLFDYPILMPDTTQVFLAVDECNKGMAKTKVRINNLGGDKLTFSVPNVGNSLVTQVASGLAPSEITFLMEPGRSGITRQAGTNVFTGPGAGPGTGFPINVTMASREAINFPPTLRIYMNFRNPDQSGVIHPVPVGVNNNEGLQELLLDEARGRLYITNSGYNRIEVFDTGKQRFLAPIEVGQLPRAMAMSLDASTLYVGNMGGESISIVDLESGRQIGAVEFPPIPRQGAQNPIRPVAMAMGLSGLQFMMLNPNNTATFWRLVGNQATPRVANSITPVQLPGPASFMAATPGGEQIVTLAGNGQAYLYDALIDNYVNSRQLVNQQPPISYFGPLSGGKDAAYFLANGLILSSSLSVIGGAERPGTTQFGPPPAPGQPPTQTIVSAGQRNVASVWPLDENLFVRLTTPVRQNINAVTRDDPRPTIELVDIRTGAESLVAVAPENPPQMVFATQRANVPSKRMVVDSKGTSYSITLSGLSVIPLTIAGTPARPQITGGSRGIVNASDGTTSLRPGAFIAVNGTNLAAAATAEQLPPPSVLGGSCVVFNDVAVPLLQTSTGQILAQIPEDARPGLNVVQVRSLAGGQSSDPVLVTVQRP